jgi:hypothetical protein
MHGFCPILTPSICLGCNFLVRLWWSLGSIFIFGGNLVWSLFTFPWATSLEDNGGFWSRNIIWIIFAWFFRVVIAIVIYLWTLLLFKWSTFVAVLFGYRIFSQNSCNLFCLNNWALFRRSLGFSFLILNLTGFRYLPRFGSFGLIISTQSFKLT